MCLWCHPESIQAYFTGRTLPILCESCHKPICECEHRKAILDLCAEPMTIGQLGAKLQLKFGGSLLPRGTYKDPHRDDRRDYTFVWKHLVLLQNESLVINDTPKNFSLIFLNISGKHINVTSPETLWMVKGT